ncbi:hypothetical protein VaNZ11_006090 [Volvox africanus]|uniref:EamA domain-containing protein n=1 Tax=Volvox africanus TaxID=51714 RepID=A0ABQ5S162_9CHLO|nr:hypothetical protein VaNZ11_006090 [Volvox africanus]
MQRSCLLHPNGSSKLTTSALSGKRACYCRVLRRSCVTAATRSDWRAEIEGSDSGSDKSATTTTTATLQSPAEPRPAASAPPPAAAVPPSPWSQSGPSSRAPQQQPAATAAGAAAGAAAAAPTATPKPEDAKREEPLSLPAFDPTALFSSPKNQASAFTALAATSAILSVLCVVEPQAILHVALPEAYTSDLDVTFLRTAGVTLAASAAVEYSLKHAAESQLLKSATYQRLMAGCALKSVAFLAVLAANTPSTLQLWSLPVWLAYVGTAVVAGAINLSVISNTSGKGLAPPPLDLNVPQNPTSWGYATCTALYLLTVLACFAPETLYTGDSYSAVTPLLKGVWAPGFLLAAVMSFVLKDASDRGRLGASTFKNLNLGLAALEYGYSIIFGSAILSDQVDIDLPAVSNLGGSLLIATFALYTYATAKK